MISRESPAACVAASEGRSVHARVDERQVVQHVELLLAERAHQLFFRARPREIAAHEGALRAELRGARDVEEHDRRHAGVGLEAGQQTASEIRTDAGHPHTHELRILQSPRA
jgi:hypothetical protein